MVSEILRLDCSMRVERPKLCQHRAVQKHTQQLEKTIPEAPRKRKIPQDEWQELKRRKRN